MEIHESIAVQMAKERIEDALREAEQMRAIRVAGPHRPVRVRLGTALVRLGHWMAGQSPLVPS